MLGIVLPFLYLGVGISSAVVCLMTKTISVCSIYLSVAIFFICLALAHTLLWGAFAKEDVIKRDFISMMTLPNNDVTILRKEEVITEVKIGNNSYSNIVSKNETPSTLTLNKIVSREKMWGMCSFNKDKFEVVLE